MTKRLLLFLLALGALTITSAQDFDLFVLAGPVASQIDGDHMGGYNKIGGLAGFGVSRQFNKDWSALMELEYIQKGKGSFSENDGATYKVKLNYIQLPITVNYHINKSVSVEGGISFGFLLSSKFYEDGEPNDAHRPYTPYFYDVDWLLGGTYSLSEEWKINLRFSYSILPMGNMFEGDGDVYRANIWKKTGGQYNNALTLALQYWL